MSIVLFVLLGLIFYTYVGYFLTIVLMGKMIKKKVIKNEIEPHVTVLIAAYNEERGIAAKLENSLELNYPKEKLRIIVVSDGSTDRTDEIVRSYGSRGIELLRVEGRVGKTQARNVAMEKIDGNIILFSDATTVYTKDIVKNFVRNFADPSVGMVTGHLVYRDKQKTQMGIGQKLYWKYESMIKKAQTELGTLTGSVGCATAFRKSLYSPLPDNIIEDFTGPLMFVLKGYRVVYEEEAVCYEETTKKSKNEWDMRVRVIRGGMKGMIYARKILNPFSYPVASFQLISHKILRWLVPLFMLSLFFLNLNLVANGPMEIHWLILLCLQTLFYLMVISSFLLERAGIHLKLAAIPLYFTILNAASLVALTKTLTSNLESTWETNREE